MEWGPDQGRARWFCRNERRDCRGERVRRGIRKNQRKGTWASSITAVGCWYGGLLTFGVLCVQIAAFLRFTEPAEFSSGFGRCRVPSPSKLQAVQVVQCVEVPRDHVVAFKLTKLLARYEPNASVGFILTLDSRVAASQHFQPHPVPFLVTAQEECCSPYHPGRTTAGKSRSSQRACKALQVLLLMYDFFNIVECRFRPPGGCTM